MASFSTTMCAYCAWLKPRITRVSAFLKASICSGEIVKNRSWSDYSLERATTNEHLGALNVVYDGLIAEHRDAQRAVADVDPVTEDLLIGQISGLELFQWFIRAHLQGSEGELSTGGTRSEDTAARRAAEAAGE